MKEISVFDVIGPNMIGPSSSHTAGALRISRAAAGMVSGRIESVEFRLYGSFALTYKGHGTDRALIGGILGYDTEDERIRDSFQEASRREIEYSFIPDSTTPVQHPNTIDITITAVGGDAIFVTGVSTGGGSMKITSINGVSVDFTGEYTTLIVEHLDQPGMIRHISGCLSDNRINIAFMKLFREEKGQRAYTVVEADEPIAPRVIHEIMDHSDVRSAKIIYI